MYAILNSHMSLWINSRHNVSETKQAETWRQACVSFVEIVGFYVPLLLFFPVYFFANAKQLSNSKGDKDEHEELNPGISIKPRRRPVHIRVLKAHKMEMTQV